MKHSRNNAVQKGNTMSLQVINPDEIKAAVRDYYGARVQAASCCAPSSTSSGCGDGSGCCETAESALYSTAELAAIPSEAANVSFGCGNPTAIASLHPGETVLDLGSGGGIDVLLAARQVGPTGFVYGVDMTDEMLELARRNAAKMGATNVEFRKGHIEELPLPDGAVDVILSNCVINLSPDKGQTLQEAFRVLRPGGRLAISDIVLDGDWADLPVSETQVRTALSWAGCIAGALTIKEYEALLAQAGFTNIQVKIRHRYNLAELGQDQNELLAQVGPEVVEQLVHRFTSCNVEANRP
jgi:arsenite methyltransferase